MGNRSPEFNHWFLALFLMALLDPTKGLAERLSTIKVIVIDGSLVKRRHDWQKHATTFNDWLNLVFGTLENILAELPNLEYVVFLSDMYDQLESDMDTDDEETTQPESDSKPKTENKLRVIECIPKACTHECRYGKYADNPADPKRITNPRDVFQPQNPCMAVRSCDVFGVLPNRMQLDRMFTERFFQWAAQRTQADPALKIILHGGVEDNRALDCPWMISGGVRSEYLSRIGSRDFCRCSEGDPRLAYWACEFSDMPQAWWSCDTDILQVILQHMRRMVVLPMEQVPDTLLIKDVNATKCYFDARELYRQVMHKLGQPPFNWYPEDQHPVDLISLFLALGGNDMCHPVGISQKQREKCKTNDGVRTPFFITAFAEYGRLIGPILRSRAEHIIPNSRYCVQGLPCRVFHFGVDTFRLGALIAQAAVIQKKYGTCRIADDSRCEDRATAVATAARLAWSGHYYGNAHVPGYVGPSGEECSLIDGKSLYGFYVERGAGARSTSMGSADWTADHDVHQRWIVWGCHPEDAPTAVPSPVYSDNVFGDSDEDNSDSAHKKMTVSALDSTVQMLDGFVRSTRNPTIQMLSPGHPLPEFLSPFRQSIKRQ